MKKKIMITMLVLLLISVAVAAVSIGDVFTQEQFDSINIDNKTLQVGWTESLSDLKTKCNDVKICSREYWIEDMQQQFSINETTNESYYNGTLIVVNSTGEIKFRAKVWYDKQEVDASAARQEFKDWTNAQLARRVEDKKEDLKGLQTEVTYDLSAMFDE